MKLETESLKHTQTKVKQQMKKLESQTENSEVRLTNTMQQKEEILSGIDEKTKEVDTSVK